MFGAEWGVAGEENIDDDAERPEVDGFGVTGRGVAVSGAGENLAEGSLAERGREQKWEEEREVRGEVFERAHGAGHTCGGGDETSRPKIC